MIAWNDNDGNVCSFHAFCLFVKSLRPWELKKPKQQEPRTQHTISKTSMMLSLSSAGAALTLVNLLDITSPGGR
jgi:hypothetical protein